MSIPKRKADPIKLTEREQMALSNTEDLIRKQARALQETGIDPGRFFYCLGLWLVAYQKERFPPPRELLAGESSESQTPTPDWELRERLGSVAGSGRPPGKAGSAAE